MPYIEVETLPDGVEEADVVPRSDYDAVVTERDEYASQRDTALSQIEEAQESARKSQAKYAALMLNMGNEGDTNKKHDDEEVHKGTTIESLFRKVG